MKKLLLVLFLTAGAWYFAGAGELLFENSNFEQGNLTNWTAEGTAFQYQPVRDDNVYARTKAVKANYQGSYWIGTFEKYTGAPGTEPGSRQGDRPTGTLTSVTFTVRCDQIRFLIGGGKDPENTCVQLLVGDQVVRSAAGNNRETMASVSWDVSDLLGKEARVRIVDNKTGGWGHINADAFVYAGKCLPESPAETVPEATAPAEADAAVTPTSADYPTGSCMATIAPLLPGTTDYEAHGSLADNYCKVRMQVKITVENAFSFYEAEMARKGWQKVHEVKTGDGSMQVFHRGKEIFQVSAWPSNGYVDMTFSREQ